MIDDVVADYLNSRTDKNTGTDCWHYTGHIKGGYGRASLAIKRRCGDERTHRISYRLHKGQIPEGMLVRHRCDNPPCINPDHLEVGTHQQNVDDMMERGRRPSPRGEGSYVWKLTDSDVLVIGEMRAHGFQFAEIASLFGVQKSTAHYAVHSRLPNTKVS